MNNISIRTASIPLVFKGLYMARFRVGLNLELKVEAKM